MKRTNIMLTDEQHRHLKAFARKKGTTLGELIRRSVDRTYKKQDSLEHRKSIALESYKEGLISLGKLSEILGIDTVSVRLYLKEQRIPIKTQEIEEVVMDAVNA